MSYTNRGPCLGNACSMEGNAGPEAHTCLTLEKTNFTQYTWQKNTALEWQEWHGNERRQTYTVVALAQGPGHNLCVPSQYMGVGSSVKGFKGCGLEVGRKEIYSRVPAETPFGKMLCWDGISPKRGKYKLGPLDACHRGRYCHTPNQEGFKA